MYVLKGVQTSHQRFRITRHTVTFGIPLGSSFFLITLYFMHIGDRISKYLNGFMASED
jgi:hypothetical protein